MSCVVDGTELEPTSRVICWSPIAATRWCACPDLAFARYLGIRLEPTLPEKDRRWVIEQVMAAEAPEAVGIVQRSMRDLFDPTPRRARRSTLRGE